MVSVSTANSAPFVSSRVGTETFSDKFSTFVSVEISS